MSLLFSTSFPNLPIWFSGSSIRFPLGLWEARKSISFRPPTLQWLLTFKSGQMFVSRRLCNFHSSKSLPATSVRANPSSHLLPTTLLGSSRLPQPPPPPHQDIIMLSQLLFWVPSLVFLSLHRNLFGGGLCTCSVCIPLHSPLTPR